VFLRCWSFDRRAQGGKSVEKQERPVDGLGEPAKQADNGQFVVVLFLKLPIHNMTINSGGYHPNGFEETTCDTCFPISIVYYATGEFVGGENR